MYSILIATMFALFSLLSAHPLASQGKRDIGASALSITSPSSSTTWTTTLTYELTWSTDDEFSETVISEIILRHGTDEASDVILAEGVSAVGVVSVTVPAGTPPDTNYVIIILFAEVEAQSAEFAIIEASF